jgi:hypothetical protein
LEELLLIDIGHLPTDCLVPFRAHPRRRIASAGLGSLRLNREALSVLPNASNQTLASFEFSED